MWTEAHKSGKVNFVERYKDPYTQKWKRTSVLMEKDTPRIRKEAQKILDAKIADILSKLKASEMLFTDLFDQWWAFYQQEIKRSSIASLRGNIKEISESSAIGIKVVKIDPKYIQNYLDSLDCSRNKKERTKSMLNLAFDYAVDLDIIKDNPARRAKLPRIKRTLADWKKVEEKYLEEDEIQPLLKELYRRPSTYRIALLSEFMSLNGCRIGEAVSLEPGNRDFETKVLQLHGTYDHTEGYRNGEKTTPKTNASYRETIMTTREMEILEEMEFINELEKKHQSKIQGHGLYLHYQERRSNPDQFFQPGTQESERKARETNPKKSDQSHLPPHPGQSPGRKSSSAESYHGPCWPCGCQDNNPNIHPHHQETQGKCS